MSNKKVIKNGYWIVIEGLDGTGKTTAINYLKDKLINNDYKVIIVRGLGTGHLGLQIREVYLNNQLNEELKPIYMAVSLSECYTAILKYLDEGYVVLSDRFIGSYYSYNCVANNDVTALNIFKNVLNNEDVFKGSDVEIFVNSDLPIIKRRLSDRNDSNYIDRSTDNYFLEVYGGYQEYKLMTNSTRQIDIYNNSSIEDFNKKLLDLYLDLNSCIESFVLTNI
jgi:dTMP kinase